MNSKSLLKGTLAAVLLTATTFGSLSSSPASAAGAADVKIIVNSKTLSLDVKPQMIKGRTLVPYSALVQAIGGSASWDAKTKTVTAKKDSVNVTYTIGSTTAYKNGGKLTLDTAPIIVDGKALVPLRFISEAFGNWVSWDQPSQTIRVDTSRTIETKAGPLTLKKKPERIVTLSSSDTEIIYALGGIVVGRSTALGKVYPAEAASVPEIGSTHSIAFEKLATLKPDLVIASPSLAQNKATIEKLGAQVLFNSHNTVEDIQASISLYGKVLGQEEKAAKLIASMTSDIKSITAPKVKPKALILYGAPGSFVVALPSSYPGNFLELAGGKNVAANFPKMDTMPQYAELSMERIVAADPDVIYLITHGDPKEIKASFKKEIENNAAWKSLGAVKNEQFEVLDNELFAANPGLRAPTAIRALNSLLLQVKL